MFRCYPLALALISVRVDFGTNLSGVLALAVRRDNATAQPASAGRCLQPRRVDCPFPRRALRSVRGPAARGARAGARQSRLRSARRSPGAFWQQPTAH